MVQVKDLTELSLRDLWEEVKDEDDWCGCATIMSVGRCSVKMSVHEDIDIDGNGTEAVTGNGRCVGRSVKGDRSLWFDGSERAPRMATTGSIQKGRSCCLRETLNKPV